MSSTLLVLFETIYMYMSIWICIVDEHILITNIDMDINIDVDIEVDVGCVFLRYFGKYTGGFKNKLVALWLWT